MFDLLPFYTENMLNNQTPHPDRIGGKKLTVRRRGLRADRQNINSPVFPEQTPPGGGPESRRQ
jgi:hypothetical protein